MRSRSRLNCISSSSRRHLSCSNFWLSLVKIRRFRQEETVEMMTAKDTPANQMVQRTVIIPRRFFWIRLRIESMISIYAPCPRRIVLQKILWPRLLGSSGEMPQVAIRLLNFTRKIIPKSIERN